MTKRLTLGNLLLMTSALVAPAALAQPTGGGSPSGSTTSGGGAPAASATPAPADPRQSQTTTAPQADAVDVSAPGVGNAAPASEDEIVVTGRNIPEPIRNTPAVVSVLSAADLGRTGEGDIAGALTRVTGLSVVGGRFVYVRGLGERYSSALLNGSPLPSPEPLRRVVPLDIFPTSVLASALVQKSYSVNYPGEFGGGVINLTTAATPKEPFLTIGGSISGDTETTQRLGYTYYGSRTDWTGFDNGTRDTPPLLKDALGSGKLVTAGNFANIRDITASLVNAKTTLLQTNNNIPFNGAVDVSGGTSFEVRGATIGVVASAGLDNSWRTRDATQQVSSDGLVSGIVGGGEDYRAVVTDNRIVASGLLGFSLKAGDQTLRWTNLYIRDTIKQGRLARGIDYSGGDPVEGIRQATYWFERQLIDTQLAGEFKFGDFSLNTRGTYANSQREAPYERTHAYQFNRIADDFVSDLLTNGQTARVAFSDLEDHVWSGSADLGYRLPTVRPITVSGGYYYYRNTRSATRREFRYLPAAPLPFGVTQERPDFLLSDYNVYTYNITLSETSGAAGAAAYDASLLVHAGYGRIEADITDRLKFEGGVRYEDGRQTVSPIDLFGSGTLPTLPALKKNYWLPAATVTWTFIPNHQIRVAASKTIARPQFRELAPQIYQDTDSDRRFSGNQFLTDSTLLNAEARYEYYFGRGERFSLAGFYKRIKNPIESFAFFPGDALQIGFLNAPKATLYGGEVEVQKYVPLAGLADGDFFASRRLVLIGNYTYTKSELKVAAGDTTIFTDGTTVAAAQYFRDGDPLTGQSDHLVNVQIGLEDEDHLSQQTFLLNYASDRVTNRGPVTSGAQQPPLVERPGLSLDFVARQGVTLAKTEFELKFEARNITRTKFQEFQQGPDGSKVFTNRYDVGARFSLGLAVKL